MLFCCCFTLSFCLRVIRKSLRKNSEILAVLRVFRALWDVPWCLGGGLGCSGGVPGFTDTLSDGFSLQENNMVTIVFMNASFKRFRMKILCIQITYI